MKFSYKRSFNCIIAFVAVFAVMFIMCAVFKLAPVGDGTLASKDDYNVTAYIKAVLDGRENLFYSFSGNTGSGIFHHLSEVILSPLTLLTALASSADFNTFYDLFMIIRISLAAAACAAFINYVFMKEEDKKGKQYLRDISCVAASVLYAFAGITVTGGFATVDGLIFLPLIILGVYKITVDKGAQMLLISLLMNLIVNWYTGLINAAVAVLWFVFEMVMNITGSDGFVKQGDIRTVLMKVVRFVVSVVLALATSSFAWYTAIRLLPGAEAVSTMGVTSNLPGIGVIILGALSLLVFLALTNSGYRLKITVFVFTAVFAALLMVPSVSSVIGGGKLDAGIRPVRYILAFLMVYFFGKTFLVKNNFTRRPWVRETAAIAAGVFLIVQVVAGLYLPMSKTYTGEVTADYDSEATTVKTLVKAVDDLDKGTYRIGFVREDLKQVTLLSSTDDYIYFDDTSYKVDPAGDIIGTLYPYAVRYFVSKADLTEISGGGQPLGEFNGYKVYYNSYSIPMAFVFDGNYFDSEFKGMTPEDRLLAAGSAREHIPTGLTVTSDDIKFSVNAAKDNKLFVSVPYDSNMKVTLNGSEIVPSIYSGRFFSVNLAEGANNITVTYDPAGFDHIGIVSLISLLMLVLFVFIENFYDMHYPHQ